MPCHAPHKNQRQVLPLPLLHGLFGRVPVGIAQGIVIDLICWLRQQRRRWRHAPCWKFIAAFRHAFYDNFIFTFIGIDIFLIVATNKTKIISVATLRLFCVRLPPLPEMEFQEWVQCTESRRYWTAHDLCCPLLSCPVLSWNLSLSTHHLHLLAFIRIRIRINKKNKEKRIHRMLLNAIKNNITRMRGIKLLWFQKKIPHTIWGAILYV